MISELISLVHSLGRGRILLIGDLILDRYCYGDAERVSPEAPVPVLRSVDQHDRVGGSANVAACLRAMGTTVRCFGTVGDDSAGRRLQNLLNEMGVQNDDCVVCTDRPTTTKTRFVGLAQHRHRQQILRFDEESVAPLPSDIRDRLIAAVTGAINDCDVVCIEDYQKGVVSHELLDAITATARRLDKPVIVDPARLNDFGHYAGATILTPNRNELELATGRSYATASQVIDSCTELHDRWNVNCLVITLDREGAVLSQRSRRPIHVGTRARSVYDNTGAGDAVLAMLAAAVAVGADLEHAVYLCNVAGGLEVEKFGCVPISADEILADLRIENRRRNGKLRGVEELLAELNLRRDRGETVVFTNGVFDVLHPGHIDYLNKAREMGSLLVVGVNSDSSVRQLGKGDDRPVNDQEFRSTLLGALECVDYVVIFDEPDPLGLIQRIRPDVLVKGADWSEDSVVGRESVEQNGGRVTLVPILEGFSSTAVIQRIRNGH